MTASKLTAAQKAFIIMQDEEGTASGLLPVPWTGDRKPNNNAFIEAFNGKFWTECLNAY